MIKHISVHITLALIIGIILGHYFNFSARVIWLLLGVGSILLWLAYFISNKIINPRFYLALASFTMLVFIGIGRVHFTKSINYKNHYTHLLKEQNTLILSINSILKPTKNYTKYEARVLQINNTNTTGKLLFHIKKDSLVNTLEIGQILFTNANIFKIDSPKNPFQFSYKDYLENRQIYTQIYTSFEDIKILNKRKRSIYSVAGSFRKRVINTLIDKGLKGDELAVIKALLLGERNQISSSLREDYVAAGAIHILAISGLHIGIIMALLSFILKPLLFLKRGKNIRLVLIILALWIYAIIAGLSPSILRATTMFTAISIGLFSNRKIDIYNVLAISAFLLLFVKPSFLFDVGFKMSYLAVIAIVALQPKFAGLWKPKLKVVNYFWQLICVSAAAQIGVLPLSLFYFHQFPGLFFITNIVVIPVLGLILGFGLLMIALASFNILPEVFVYYYQLIIHYLNVFIMWIAQQEDFLFKNIPFSFAVMLISYLIIISTYLLFTKKTLSCVLLTCFTVLSLQFVVFYEKYTTVNSNKFIVFDNFKEPLVAIKKGQNLQLLTKNNSNEYLLKSYLIGAHIKKVDILNKPTNIFLIDKQKLLIVDENAVFEPLKNADLILLTQSPKINLQSLIRQLNPRLIIADGTNYKSLIKLWQETCKKQQVEFYYTTKEGAFIYSF